MEWWEICLILLVAGWLIDSVVENICRAYIATHANNERKDEEEV